MSLNNAALSNFPIYFPSLFKIQIGGAARTFPVGRETMKLHHMKWGNACMD